MQASIFYPLIAMVALTLAVWIRLYIERIGEIRGQKISPQELADTQQASAILKRQNAANNFKNLFEIPVLFYLLCISLFVTSSVTSGYLIVAWLFVLLRVVHSVIHCSYNRVVHRFSVYVISTMLLFGMWTACLFDMLQV